MKYTGVILLAIVFCTPAVFSQPQPWEAVVSQFVADYERLDIEPLHLAYAENLAGIRSKDALRQQVQVFDALQNSLAHFEYEKLLPGQQLEYDLLQHHLSLNEERIQLEQQWELARPPGGIPADGLASLPNGKAWYAHFLKRWIDRSVTPDALFEFGISEIAKVQSELKGIQERSGMDRLAFQQYINSEVFFYNDVAAVQQAFEAYSDELIKKLPAYFPEMAGIPEIRIRQGTLERLSQVPAFYSNNTLFYNFFDRPFNKRQIAWVYLHEALPGHHYERNYSRAIEQSPVQRLFYSPGYSEGWAAYVEEIGNEIGAYQSIYDELGKWEWDIIRSVRVPLDVGLNYYGWSDEQALAFWRRHITGQDDIGRREIARMKRWPCQVITYKYGADKILQWKAQFERQPGFSLKAFHTEVLKRGPLPFSILEGLISDFLRRNALTEATADTIPFVLTGHNNISVQAVLNEKDTVQLMFHTAASSMTIIKDTAKKLSSLKLNQADTVKSWGGEHASKYSNDNALQIGNLKWEQLTVWENEHSGPMTDGKFGPDLFQDKVLEVNFDENFMVVHASLPEVGEGYEKLNLVMEHGFLFIEGTMRIGERDYKNRFLIHSGYGGALLLDDEFVRANDIGSQLEITEESELKDSFGNILKTKKAILPSFTLGNKTLPNLPVGFFEGSIGRQKMSVMGGAVLKQFNMIVDFKNSCIYLKGNSLMR